MKFLDRRTIKSKLIASFIAIAIALVFFGIFILIEMDTLGNLTTTLYEHPLRVSNAAQSAHKGVIRIQGLMQDIIVSKNVFEFQEQMDRIQQEEKDVLDQLNIVQNYILGERGEEIEAEARQTFFQWKKLRLQILSLIRDGKRKEGVQIFKLENAELVNTIELNMRDLTAYARKKADGFMNEANKVQRNITTNTIIVLGLLVLFFYFVSSTLIKHLIGRISDLQSMVSTITETGNFKEISVIGDNELTKLAVSFNDLIRSLSRQLWLREGLNKLNDELTVVSSLELFAESILKFLATRMQAGTGAFFLYNDKEKSSSMLASYSMAESNKLTRKFADGDGIVGQVAKERSPRILTVVTPDEGLIESGTVSASPNILFAYPLIFADKLLGVVELTSFHELGTIEQAFMKTASHNIATALNAIIQRKEIDALYDETRVQNIELTKAGEIARKAKEEIELRNKELSIRSEELKLQANLLSLQKNELEVKKVQVEESDRLKSEFLSNMSHELRTPLNSILALSQLMQIKGTGRDEKKEAEYLNVIERNGKHLLSLINDILDLSKIESGRMEVYLSSFIPAELLEEVSATIRPMAEDKSLSFITRVDCYQSMLSDRDKIRQILLNLLSNSIKFTDEGTIEVELGTEDDHLVLHVKDTGIGIAPEDQEDIFDEFRQVDGSTSRRHEGTGLGLAICKKLAIALEGDLEVVSELGRGSSFILRLPLRLSNYKEKKRTPLEVSHKKNEKSMNTVLVVDDDPKSREIITDHLINAGYDVIEADNGRQALDLAASNSLVGITLDIFMPGMDGWETLNLLKSNPSTMDIPVIVVSISDDTTTGYVLGATSHLTKPVDKHQLLFEINKLKKQAPIKKVLIVDDNENDRAIISNILEESGYSTIEADNGWSGVDKAVNLLPDAMTLDLLMPEMDGFQVLEEIDRLPQLNYLPVIIVTAKDLSSEEHKKLLDRSRSIVQKGDLDVKTLLQKLENGLDNIRLQIPEPSKQNECKAHVLVIEDNDIATMQIAGLLQELGLRMSHAASAEKAEQLVELTKPDLILIDLMISSFSVFDLFETISSKSETANTPVIVLTGRDLTDKDLDILKKQNVRQFNRKEPLDRELFKELILTSVQGIMQPDCVNLPEHDFWEVELPDAGSNDPFGKGNTIVVVEDNKDNIVTLKAILDDFQGELHVAYDGESGLKKIREIMPDIVLMDIQLPGINGLEATAAIKSSDDLKHIPVIAVTARAMKGDKEKIMSAGCDGLLTKPYDVEILRAMLFKWLMQKS
ncbi:response regulator [Maridesulfovibrio zosterae]|uniref:response regulator n=1 Tax=Maridesulfovibrio zosterae TaxID=82171 RepID=UPI0003FCC8CC|nr:response regulator [Maridesulfovibrio zosterae]